MVKKSGLGKGLDSLIPSAGAKKSNPAKSEVKKEVVVEKVVKKEEVMLNSLVKILMRMHFWNWQIPSNSLESSSR